MYQSLFTKIRNFEQKSNGKQKTLAQYFLSNFEEASFQTVAEVACKARVSEATVVRFARGLGYKGFPHLKDEFQNVILKKLAPSERLHKIFDTSYNSKKIINHALEREIQNIIETQKRLQIENIEQIAQCIIDARRKYIVGLRASSGCAYLLGHFLSRILPDIVTILDGDTRLFEGLKAIGKEDILIAISYPRYTKRTVEALQFVKDRHINTIVITDSELSPAAQISEFTIVAPANSSNFTNSYTACLSIINLLITLIINFDKYKTERMLREWEKALEGFDFFYKNKAVLIS